MWLLTAIGPVHGQSKFTFALQQRREYTVGRDDACDIRFESKQVRPKEGVLILDDWDSREPSKPPSLRWRAEPKKNGSYGSIKTLTLNDLNDGGSTDITDYQTTELSGSQGCFLDSGVQGVQLAENMWFTSEWKGLALQYDKMKDENDETLDLLRKHCIFWSASFDLVSRPTYVISPTLRSNVDCNYAVCFGIRILLPSYLEALIARIKNCWKKMADSQDSFVMPDEEDESFQPELEQALPASRKDRNHWLPDPSRETLFKGWKLMGLRGKTQSVEKRYLLALGADYQDMDVLTNPVSTSQDFADRLTEWLSYVDATGGGDQAAVVWFMPVKSELTKKGIDYVSVIQGTCQRLGVYHTNGGVLWGSVAFGGVDKYLTASATNLPPSAAPKNAPSSIIAESVVPAKMRRAVNNAEPNPATSQAGPSIRPNFVPSTFPEETEGLKDRSPSPEKRTTKPVRRTRQASSPPSRQKTPEPEASPTTSKRPLRRRANKAPFEAPDSPPLSGANTADEASQPSQPLFSQPEFVQDSMPQATQASVYGAQPTQTQSMIPDSVIPTQSVSQAPGRSSRLKRRVGGATPSLVQEIADTSINLERDIKAEEQAASIRELYEQTKAGSFAPSHYVSKRPRLATVDSEESASSIGPRGKRVDDAMDVGDESYGSKQGKSIGSRRGASEDIAMPPPAQRPRRLRSPSEEEEEVENRAGPSKSLKGKTGQVSPVKASGKGKSQSQKPSQSAGPSKDEAFLQAISKSTKSRKAIDELDKVFNQLRIPKPNGGSTVVKANEWEASHPDYGLLNDLDDDLRGNFIQIVRKDLFRKDTNNEKGNETVTDGRPNFKKFKKKNVVRKEPVHLMLAGPTAQDAEMGEPYWPTQVIKNGRGKTQASQFAQEEEEEDMPLLPRSRKRLLGTNQINQDDDEPASTARPNASASQRRSRVPETQPTQVPAVGSASQRRTRGASVVSEADSVGTTTSVATSTRGRSIGGKASAGTASTTKSKAKGKAKPEPTVLEDSEEEGVDWGTSSGKTGARSGKTRTIPGQTTGTVTLDDDTPAHSTRGGRRTATQATGTQSSGIGTRRKLLPADDDDGMAFRGLGKKRRLNG